MKLEFAKLHGLGNDFVFVDDLSREIELTPEQVACLCDRHFGIGADGVILVRPSERPECAAYMHYINSDGTLAEMCGNGVRCFAKYLVDRGYVRSSERSLIADTLSGPKPIGFEIDAAGSLTSAKVDMGAPIFDPASVPVAAQTNAQFAQAKEGLPADTARGEAPAIDYVRELPIESPWGTFRFTCISMGNPHAVCFIDDWQALPDDVFIETSGKNSDVTAVVEKNLTTFDVGKVGAFFESHELFPQKTNVEFAVIQEQGIDMRVFERGCGETLACGTGACATAVAAHVTERAGRESDVNLLGGSLHIVWSDNGRVFMTGPTVESFSGVVEV